MFHLSLFGTAHALFHHAVQELGKTAARASDHLRITENRLDCRWPDRTQAVSYVGDAYVIRGSGDFDLADLNRVRNHFPERRVTLDGDVITVWPSPRQDE
jgi:hypothetical protein